VAARTDDQTELVIRECMKIEPLAERFLFMHWVHPQIRNIAKLYAQTACILIHDMSPSVGRTHALRLLAQSKDKAIGQIITREERP